MALKEQMTCTLVNRTPTTGTARLENENGTVSMEVNLTAVTGVLLEAGETYNLIVRKSVPSRGRGK